MATVYNSRPISQFIVTSETFSLEMFCKISPPPKKKKILIYVTKSWTTNKDNITVKQNDIQFHIHRNKNSLQVHEKRNLKILCGFIQGYIDIKYGYCIAGRSQCPRGLRRRSAAARLLRLCFRIPPGAWMFVCCESCVLLSGRGLCDELITRPE
jgi:hypothetical protein